MISYHCVHVSHTSLLWDKTSLSCLLIGREPSIPVTAAANRMPPNLDTNDSAILMEIRLIRYKAKKKQPGDNNVSQSQKWYEQRKDRNVCHKPLFRTGGFVILEHLTMKMTVAKGLAAGDYLKLHRAIWDCITSKVSEFSPSKLWITD